MSRGAEFTCRSPLPASRVRPRASVPCWTWNPDSSIPLVDPRRLVELEAVHNFRDLGGYPARDGPSPAGTQLYRADGLHRLSDADIETRPRAGSAHRGRPAFRCRDLTSGAPSRTSRDRGRASPPSGHRRDLGDRARRRPQRPRLPGVGVPARCWPSARHASPGRSRRWPCPVHCRPCSTARPARIAPVCWLRWCSSRWACPRAVVLADYELTVEGMERMRAGRSCTAPRWPQAWPRCRRRSWRRCPRRWARCSTSWPPSTAASKQYVRVDRCRRRGHRRAGRELLVNPAR